MNMNKVVVDIKEFRMRELVARMQKFSLESGLIPVNYLLHSNSEIFSMNYPEWILERKIKHEINRLENAAKKMHTQCECHFAYNLDYFSLYYHYTICGRL